MSRTVVAALLVVAAVFAAFTVARSVVGIGLPDTGIDIYYFWYHSYYIFVRHGPTPFPSPDNPTSMEFEQPPVPSATTPLTELMSPPASPYPPSVLLLLSPLARLPYPVAKAVWTWINLALAVFIGWQTARLFLPRRASLRRVAPLLILVCLGLLPTRNVITNGQTTLLILSAMLLSVRFSDRHAGWSGAAFGVALSKYSLAAPVGLWLLYRRRWWSSGLAVALQLAAFVVMAVVVHTAPWTLVRLVASTLSQVGHMPGIHLATWVGHAVSPTSALAGAYTLVIGGGLAYWLTRHTHTTAQPAPTFTPLDAHLLTIVGLWSLLVVYHREYDAVLYILFVGLVVAGLTENWWRLGHYARVALAAWTVAGVFWLSRPGVTFAAWLPSPLADGYLAYAELGTTVVVLVSSLAALALLYRLRPLNLPAAPPER